MKSLERISILANVLTVACSRPATEVGKLVKAIVAYATDGIRPTLDDIRLETFFDLIAHDLDSQRAAAEVKSHKCSESAKCRTAKTPARPATPPKKANADVPPQPADAVVDEISDDAESKDDAVKSVASNANANSTNTLNRTAIVK